MCNTKSFRFISGTPYTITEAPNWNPNKMWASKIYFFALLPNPWTLFLLNPGKGILRHVFELLLIAFWDVQSSSHLMKGACLNIISTGKVQFVESELYLSWFCLQYEQYFQLPGKTVFPARKGGPVIISCASKARWHFS